MHFCGVQEEISPSTYERVVPGDAGVQSETVNMSEAGIMHGWKVNRYACGRAAS